MMRGEYYAPPPAAPKPVETVRRKRAPAAKSSSPMTDMLPPEDYGTPQDTFGFSIGPKKDESEDEKQ